MGRTSQDALRCSNILSLLRCVREHAPLSKKEVKELTGLSWGSVSGITTDLIRKRVLREIPRSGRTQVGRTPMDIVLETDRCCILGFELNIGGISGVLMDLNSDAVLSLSEPIRDTSREAVLRQFLAFADRMIDQLGSRRDALLGIGIAMQGTVDNERGISVYTPYFSDWHNVELKRIFEERYGVEAWIEHSPNCQALYEKQIGVGKGFRNIVYVRLSAGIGMSIIINDTMWRGADGNAGELGHLIVEPNGRKCACGKRGCLETAASSKALVELAREHTASGGETALTALCGNDPQRIDLPLIYDAACQGDPFCRSLFERMGTLLGQCMSAIVNLFNPAVIIFGGTMVRYEALFSPAMKRAMEERAWKYSACRILFSHSRQNTATVGAGLLVANRFFEGGFPFIFEKEQT